MFRIVRFASIFDVINSHALICWKFSWLKTTEKRAQLHHWQNARVWVGGKGNGMANKRIKLKKNCEAIRIFIFTGNSTLSRDWTTSEQIHFISENGKSFSYNSSPLFSLFLSLLLLFFPFHFFFCTFSFALANWMYSSCFFANWLRWICNGRPFVGCGRVCVFVSLSVCVHGQTYSYRYLCSVFSAKGQVRSVSIWMMALN